jgi:hypothetical protein
MKLSHLFESTEIIDCMEQPFKFGLATGVSIVLTKPAAKPRVQGMSSYIETDYALRFPGDGNAYQAKSFAIFASGETVAAAPEKYGPQKIGILKTFFTTRTFTGRFNISPLLDPHGDIELKLEQQYTWFVKAFNNLAYLYYHAHVNHSMDEDAYEDELDRAKNSLKQIISTLSHDMHLSHATIFGKHTLASSMKLIEQGVKEYVNETAIHTHNMENHVDELTAEEEGQTWDWSQKLEKFDAEHTYNEKASELYYEKWKRVQFTPFIRNNADIDKACFFNSDAGTSCTDFSFHDITAELYIPNPNLFSKPIAEQMRKDFEELDGMLLNSFKAMEAKCKGLNILLYMSGAINDMQKVLSAVGYNSALAKYLKQYATDLVAEYATPATATRFSKKSIDGT